MELKIANMSCDGCVRSVTRAVQSVDPEAKVQADLPAHLVKVETKASQAAIQEVLAEVGYPAVAVGA